MKIVLPLLTMAKTLNCLAKTNGKVIVTARFPNFLLHFLTFLNVTVYVQEK